MPTKTSQQKIPDVGKIEKLLRAPLSVGIEITNKCNFNCVYCYNKNHGNQDMKVKDFERVISILETVGVFSISISGGEPLCHDKFKDICKIIKKSKLNTALMTNGYFVKKYTQLINTVFDQVYISIDGPENIHNKLRMGFQVIIEGLKEIKIRKIMAVTLTKANSNYLEEIIKISKENSFDAICLFVLKPVGRGKEVNDTLSLNGQDLQRIKKKITKLKQKIKITFADPTSESCYAGKQLLYILPDGTVKPCAYSPFKVGNILHEDWNTLWKKCQNFPTTCHAFL
ncbi:MAG: hypothetical protein CO145_01750 [Candidatus Nealsonbacteria bacterium CG_4_9_14_3_um_filter_37_13]|uniref:Radical SAM core domain-containing protein n=2 Tax=Candidatus Nealsoniibacteriota TaxID=1817911 RepID=A0A2H0TIU7_9BACT|nr:MAG: hypothetical protein COU43_02570 [Candidatus Nealsonbacteria bacterium CG10_big_fil_rev_8_21_14_0_10_37_25]PJA84217.1 MAG: hypothetical protein CO145_01750 [Candidatus Nealsonbacteria bacterium CG_4_9_14_3_um_filter_37_13]